MAPKQMLEKRFSRLLSLTNICFRTRLAECEKKKMEVEQRLYDSETSRQNLTRKITQYESSAKKTLSFASKVLKIKNHKLILRIVYILVVFIVLNWKLSNR